jgi:hypothetical protein
MLFKLFGVAWVIPRKVNELLVSWRGQLGNRTSLKMWRLAPLCVMWCLWRDQNAKNFEDHETMMVDLKKMML